jgi:hypothetical protein
VAASRSSYAIIDGIGALVGWARRGKRSDQAIDTKRLGALGSPSPLDSGCERGIFDLATASRLRVQIGRMECFGPALKGGKGNRRADRE